MTAFINSLAGAVLFMLVAAAFWYVINYLFRETPEFEEDNSGVLCVWIDGLDNPFEMYVHSLHHAQLFCNSMNWAAKNRAVLTQDGVITHEVDANGVFKPLE